jgi:alpha-N-arabinofuranosidase
MTEYDIAKTGLEEKYNFEDALGMGVFLNSFFRHADVVKMANLAQLVNVIAPMFTNPQGMYYQTIYFPIAEYAKQKGNQSLDVLVDSPEYKPADRTRPLGYLDVSATYDPKSKQVYVNVLNRSEKTDITARIDSVAGAPSGPVSVGSSTTPT